MLCSPSTQYYMRCRSFYINKSIDNAQISERQYWLYGNKLSHVNWKLQGILCKTIKNGKLIKWMRDTIYILNLIIRKPTNICCCKFVFLQHTLLLDVLSFARVHTICQYIFNILLYIPFKHGFWIHYQLLLSTKTVVHTIYSFYSETKTSLCYNSIVLYSVDKQWLASACLLFLFIRKLRTIKWLRTIQNLLFCVSLQALLREILVLQLVNMERALFHFSFQLICLYLWFVSILF